MISPRIVIFCKHDGIAAIQHFGVVPEERNSFVLKYYQNGATQVRFINLESSEEPDAEGLREKVIYFLLQVA